MIASSVNQYPKVKESPLAEKCRPWVLELRPVSNEAARARRWDSESAGYSL